MRFTEIQSFFNQLNSSQKKSLSVLKTTICALDGRMSPSGLDRVAVEGRDSLINILETWLLDDEQKQSLAAGTWNIFFLYATAYLLTFDGLTDNGNPWQKSSGLNSDRSARLTDYLGTDPAALGIADTRQAEIIEKILEGYISADRMGEAIPPHLEYSSGQKIYIQSLAAGLRLAMGFNLSAPASTQQLMSLLPPGADINATKLIGLFTVESIGSHPHVQATVRVRLHCRHAEVHRALKRYEAGLQRLLYHLNRLIRPRFLFTAVQFEITPAGRFQIQRGYILGPSIVRRQHPL